MTILKVPDTAGGRTVEVLALVNGMITFPGPLTNDQKTIVNQIHGVLTSFVNSPDITNDIAQLRTQNTELSVKNAELVTRNLTLQTEKEGLVLDLPNSRSVTTAVNSLLEDARKTITSLEKRRNPSKPSPILVYTTTPWLKTSTARLTSRKKSLLNYAPTLTLNELSLALWPTTLIPPLSPLPRPPPPFSRRFLTLRNTEGTRTSSAPS